MTNDDAIKIALKNELISDIEVYQTLPKYKISLKFDKKMKHLLKNYENRESAKTGYKRIPLKNRLLIAAVIILSVAIITGGTLYITMRWADFTVKEYDIFAMLSISNAESYPLSLEERYEFTYNVTGYEKEVIDDDGIRFSVKYSDAKNKKCISYSQSIKDFYTTVRLNIENAITLPKEVIINGTTAIYYETYYGEKGVIWDIGDYIIELAATGFSEDELISMTEFVEKVE